MSVTFNDTQDETFYEYFSTLRDGGFDSFIPPEDGELTVNAFTGDCIILQIVEPLSLKSKSGYEFPLLKVFLYSLDYHIYIIATTIFKNQVNFFNDIYFKHPYYAKISIRGALLMDNSPYNRSKLLYEYRLTESTQISLYTDIANSDIESYDELNKLVYYTRIHNQRLTSSLITFETIYANCGDKGTETYGLLVLRVMSIFPPSFTRCDIAGNSIFSGILYVQDLNSNCEVLYINSTLYNISSRTLRHNYIPNQTNQYITFLNIKVTTSLAGIILTATPGTITIVNSSVLEIMLPDNVTMAMSNLNPTYNDTLLHKHVQPIDTRYAYTFLHNYRQSSTCISIPSNKNNMGYINFDNCDITFTNATNLLVLVCSGCCSYVKSYNLENKYTCPICYGLNPIPNLKSQSSLIFCQQAFIFDRTYNRRLLQLEIFNPMVIRLLFADTSLENYVNTEKDLIEYIKTNPTEFRVKYNTSIQQFNSNYTFNITLMINQNITTPGQQVDVITIRKIKK
jgi:hypothetical protein